MQMPQDGCGDVDSGNVPGRITQEPEDGGGEQESRFPGRRDSGGPVDPPGGQCVRRVTHQQQPMAAASARATKIPVSSHWNVQ
jgi:hypothetical protein